MPREKEDFLAIIMFFSVPVPVKILYSSFGSVLEMIANNF